MPRKPRAELDGDFHHVIVKGHNSEPIVTTEASRQALAGALSASFALCSVFVWAWALLTNHLHLFVCAPIENVSAAMQRALGPYAQVRNKLLGRSGRVVNGRFWSRPVSDDEYAINLLLYVLLNPLKAGLSRTVTELADYRWCSLGALLTGEPAAIEVDATSALSLLRQDVCGARSELLDLLEVRADEWRRDMLMGDLPAIIRVVAARHGLPPDTLCDGTRGRWFTQARREVVAEARRRNHSDAQIARALQLSRTAIGKLAA